MRKVIRLFLFPEQLDNARVQMYSNLNLPNLVNPV